MIDERATASRTRREHTSRAARQEIASHHFSPKALASPGDGRSIIKCQDAFMSNVTSFRDTKSPSYAPPPASRLNEFRRRRLAIAARGYGPRRRFRISTQMTRIAMGAKIRRQEPAE
jgi:hypothetical protein